MNVYDSARMADVLAPLGYAPAETPEAADMVILNTCHIREKASEKTFSELGRLNLIKQDKRAAGGDLTLAVAGCVAQAEGGEILRRLRQDRQAPFERVAEQEPPPERRPGAESQRSWCSCGVDEAGGVPTMIVDISPPSAWSRMWQWIIHSPTRSSNFTAT